MKYLTYGDLLEILIAMPQEDLEKEVLTHYHPDPDNANLIAFKRVKNIVSAPTHNDYDELFNKRLSMVLERNDVKSIFLRTS